MFCSCTLRTSVGFSNAAKFFSDKMEWPYSNLWSKVSFLSLFYGNVMQWLAGWLSWYYTQERCNRTKDRTWVFSYQWLLGDFLWQKVKLFSLLSHQFTYSASEICLPIPSVPSDPSSCILSEGSPNFWAVLAALFSPSVLCEIRAIVWTAAYVPIGSAAGKTHETAASVTLFLRKITKSSPVRWKFSWNS